MELSVVSTLYKSEVFIPELLKQLINIISELGIEKEDYEIILVDDGSPDNSLKVALEERKKYPDVNIKIIELSRNFGHHPGIMAGLSITKGKFVYLLDADMEVDVKYLKVFYETINKTSSDVVYGVVATRKGDVVKKYFGGLFWRIFNLLSDVKVPYDITNERIMNREYVNQLLTIKESNLFIGGIWHWLGYNQIPLQVEKNTRDKSSYSAIKRLRLSIEAVTSFSIRPIYYLFSFGLFLSLISVIYLLYIVIRKIINPSVILVGYTSLMGMLLFSTGVLITSISVIGIYIGKIYKETKNRPSFIIKNIYQ